MRNLLIFLIVIVALVAGYILYNDFSLSKKDDKVAINPLEELRQKCDLGDTKACGDLGVKYHTDDTYKNVDEAIKYYEIACNGGFYQSCFNLANIYEVGKEAQKDLTKSLMFYEKACDKADDNLTQNFACIKVASANELGIVGKKNDKIAFDAYKKSCAVGNPDACERLGNYYLSGAAGEKSPQSAVVLFENACAGGNVQACDNLGIMLQTGNGVQKNELKALTAYNMACANNFMQACNNLGLLILSAPEQIVNTLFINSCNAKVSAGCNNIGLIAQGAKNYKFAQEAYKQSCDMGDKQGCNLLSELNHLLQPKQTIDAAPKKAQPKAKGKAKK